MYTLRIVEDGFIQNIALGNSYTVALPISEQFASMALNFKEESISNLNSIITSEYGTTFPIWYNKDYYIVADNGKTFEKL